jgi:hypothetical protein
MTFNFRSLFVFNIKIENFTAIIQLRERLGMKVDRNVHLAIEALQGQAVDLPVVTLKARDLHYAEHFWSEKHKEGWRTHYSTNDTMINRGVVINHAALNRGSLPWPRGRWCSC